jgi:hypothetical protein
VEKSNYYVVQKSFIQPLFNEHRITLFNFDSLAENQLLFLDDEMWSFFDESRLALLKVIDMVNLTAKRDGVEIPGKLLNDILGIVLMRHIVVDHLGRNAIATRKSHVVMLSPGDCAASDCAAKAACNFYRLCSQSSVQFLQKVYKTQLTTASTTL